MLVLVTVSTSTQHPTPSTTTRFIVLAAIAVVALGILYFVRPTSPGLSVPDHVRTLAEWTVGRFDVTAVLAATTALAVVSMVRGLPYGIGAILLLGMGANLTNAAFGSWLPDVPQDLLPSGHVAAATALYCSAILISAPQWRPVVAGLGFAGVAAIGASALAAELSGLFGVIAGVLIALVWACAAAILMARSPIAAKREELRPDTAAIAFSRHRSIRL
ncbi:MULTISPECIES: hypothetical protein [Rhodococcus]|uniref:hypothetical protein n=1 Tax=Rhodococcus TaxID=1827 RepID=UPI0022A94261|nr:MULTISPECIES: hypothetical protein [Rhodococcus]MDV8008572.1 hypothetical protein [Rhodococcus sp. IEGM 1318]MDZ7915537.1 hypothetical protein [Rhodococcus sp. (in: high G+C Gram-positive bacteria)]